MDQSDSSFRLNRSDDVTRTQIQIDTVDLMCEARYFSTETESIRDWRRRSHAVL